ncbi:MAG: hypothetical protein J4F41_01970 [Alphaproteobacteria bacterium]|nr:hypothetical protein [Alphaproteobacteria bacterium]
MMINPASLIRLQKTRSFLGPHADLLMGEMLKAADGRMHASVIVLAAAILDVILREPSGRPFDADGVDIAAARDSRDAFWLRDRRNGIVHYEGGKGGLMGDGDAALANDAARAVETLNDALDLLI